MKSMSMRPGTLFLIGAIVLAAATAYFIYDFLQQAAKPKTLPERAIVMSRVEIPARQVVTPEMVTMVTVPLKLILTNSVSKIEDVVGKWTVVGIKAFEQIRLSDISEKGKVPGLSPSIPKGMRAITIGISDNTSVAGAIFPGDHVDIIANLKDPKRNEAAVQVPLQNLEVLAIDRNKKDATEGATSSLTLLASPTEAQLITVAVESGAIRVILRARGDDTVIPNRGVPLEDLLPQGLDKTDKTKPESSSPVLSSPSSSPPGKKLTITIGSSAKEYEMKASKGDEVK